jgi:hypothetical protein
MKFIVPVVLFVVSLGPAGAMAQNTPIDLNALPASIKALKWKDIDLDGLSPLEQCRSLLLMNEALDEISARLTTEADLMSEYIDTKGMGTQFASQTPVTDPAALTITDGQKVAVALLRGPMAGSSYASALADSSSDVLTAYAHLYRSTCQWKWGAMADNRLRVRSMAKFLDAQGKAADYRAWVPGEVQRRQQQQEAAMAQQQAAAAEKQQEQKEKFLEQQQQQLKQDQQQLQQQQQAAGQMQQALAAASQAQSQSNQPQLNVSDGYYPNWYYGGVGVGAAAWYRNGAYLGAAAARTDARFGAWHGAGGVGRRR